MTSFGIIPHNILPTPDPFTLSVSDQDILDFKTLLRLSKIGPRTWWNEQTDGQFGISHDWLVNAKNTWMNGFDWRQHEARINSFPNFKLTINTEGYGPLRLHFIGLFSTNRNATPVLFMHGWPGSFLEFLPMLEIMTKKYTPESLPYHVVVPSLPGFGLSSEIGHHKEFTMDAAAEIMNQLMINLGFGNGYMVQGGDVGSMISMALLTEYEACKAAHVNLLGSPGGEPAGCSNPLTPEELEHLGRMKSFQTTAFAYALEQGTRPATIGLALSSSPLALLAWIGEKMNEWADEPISLETILANVSLYWFTSSFPSGLYPYRHLVGGKLFGTTQKKPLGYSCFPHEHFILPKAWAEVMFPNMVLYTKHDKGGHFAALEQPHALLEDIEKFIETVGDIASGGSFEET